MDDPVSLGRAVLDVMMSEYDDRVQDLRALENKAQNALGFSAVLCGILFSLLGADAKLPLFDGLGIFLLAVFVFALVASSFAAARVFQPHPFPARPGGNAALLGVAQDLRTSQSTFENFLFDHARQWPAVLSEVEVTERSKRRWLLSSQLLMVFTILVFAVLFLRASSMVRNERTAANAMCKTALQ
jgi:hypothetical protein